MSEMTIAKVQRSDGKANDVGVETSQMLGRPRDGVPARDRGPVSARVNILLLGGDQPALRSLNNTLRLRAKITLAEDLPQALEKLASEEIQAVFCAACFHCGSWVEALETIGFLYPALPVIVVSEAVQSSLLAEQRPQMYAAGAFDLLLDPLNESSTMFLLEHALATGEARAWRAAS